FTTAGGGSANRIAKWNGSAWSALGTGMNAEVYALTVFDGGTGPALYAGGIFTTAGGVSAHYIARWEPSCTVFVDADAAGANDGTSWANAFRFLQDALAYASTNPSVTEIWVAEGTYKPNIKSCVVSADCNPGGTCLSPLMQCSWPAPRAQTFQLLNGVAIYGGFHGNDYACLSDGPLNGNPCSTDADCNLPPGVCVVGTCVGGPYPGIACITNADCNASPGACLLALSGETLLSERDPVANVTTLSGDLNGDDGPDFANNGENSYHVVTGSGTDATAILDGFTIRGGNANGTNPNDNGAGVYNGPGSPTITSCTFRGNSAEVSGGGMYNWSGSSPTVTNCTFTNNTAGYSGGALYCFSSNTSLRGCSLVANTAGTAGGGVTALSNGTMDLVNCQFLDNTGGSLAGAVRADAGTILKATNCLFIRNSASSMAGIAVSATASATLTNCTLSGNTCADDYVGCGLFIEGCSGCSATVTNCILWGNAGYPGAPSNDERTQIYVNTEGGGTLTLNHSIMQDFSGAYGGVGNLDADPLFFDINGADNIVGTIDDDLRLRAGSPAIDSGDTTALPLDTLDLDGDGNTAERIPIDLAGNPRQFDDPNTPDTGVPGSPVVDMGAYEFFTDCNNNGVLDSTDIAGPVSDDCNSTNWPTNGIPDECDIASCVPPNPGCGDCNLNGVPDACDIGSGSSLDTSPVDGVPDECATSANLCTIPGQELDWTCVQNWPTLGGNYPDNQPDPNAQPGVAVTLSPTTTLILDQTVVIPSLLMEAGSQLSLVQSGGQGDLQFSAPAVMDINGTVLVSGAHTIGAGGVPPDVTIGPDGVYQAAPGPAAAAAESVSASLTAATMAVVGNDCNIPPCPDGGEMNLSDDMTVTTSGDLVIDGSLANGPCLLASAAAALSYHTPPIVRVKNGSTIGVGGVLAVLGAGAFVNDSTLGVTVAGKWDNRSVRPDCFDSVAGIITLDGLTPQTFEVAATDVGPVDAVSAEPFAIGTLQVMSNAN
ncbi:MAG: right-handed parallel beta-helix repeat-containing protein, partial [Phycisphaerales bacterium]|nr:right-handed parallel beta-helix repeat-containing protein [Phycisphaerales bacterium]